MQSFSQKYFVTAADSPGDEFLGSIDSSSVKLKYLLNSVVF